jgi:ribosomal protein S15P/S13E
MPINRPSMNKPKMIKPKVGAPKPSVKPMQPEQPVVIPEEPVAVEEEKVIEIPVVAEVEEVAPELLEKMIEEENEKLEEQDAANEEIKTPPELIHEEKPVEEPVVKEQPKAKKKSSRKSSKKKEEPVAEQNEEVVNESLPNMPLSEAMEAMSEELNIEEEGWAEIKQEIVDKLKTTVIDPDISPTDMRYLAAEIDSILTDLKIYKVDVENRYKALTERMEYIRVQNAVGTNSESRKASGYAALYNHKKDPDATESINLIQIKLVLEGQLNFYNSAIETLMSRKSLLVTFLGVVKLEASI